MQNSHKVMHLFFPEQTGIYNITIGQPGIQNPFFKLYALMSGQDRPQLVAQFSATSIGRMSFDIDLLGSRIYVVEFTIPGNTMASSNGKPTIHPAPMTSQSHPAKTCPRGRFLIEYIFHNGTKLRRATLKTQRNSMI